MDDEASGKQQPCRRRPVNSIEATAQNHAATANRGEKPLPPATSTSGRTKLIPVRDFFRNPEKSRFPGLARRQQHFVHAAAQNRMNVFVQPRSGGETVRVTGETERDVWGYFWKGAGRLVYLKDFKGDENVHVVVVEADGRICRPHAV